MSWAFHGEGTVTEWAVEHTYGDGERRYFSYDQDEDEARREAELANLERLRVFRLDDSECTVVGCRVVAREVSRTAWKPT